MSEDESGVQVNVAVIWPSHETEPGPGSGLNGGLGGLDEYPEPPRPKEVPE